VQTTAIAVACADKAQSFYEGRVRPAEKLHPPWIEHNNKQVLAGFEHLDGIAAPRSGFKGGLLGRKDISQADVTTAVAYTFASTVGSKLDLAGRFPRLSHFVKRCEALPAFLKAPVPSIPS